MPFLAGLMPLLNILGVGATLAFMPGMYNTLPLKKNRRRNLLTEMMQRDFSGGSSLRMARREQRGISGMLDDISSFSSGMPRQHIEPEGTRSFAEFGMRQQINDLIGQQSQAQVAELSVTSNSDPLTIAARLGIM